MENVRGRRQDFELEAGVRMGETNKPTKRPKASAYTIHQLPPRIVQETQREIGPTANTRSIMTMAKAQTMRWAHRLKTH